MLVPFLVSLELNKVLYKQLHLSIVPIFLTLPLLVLLSPSNLPSVWQPICKLVVINISEIVHVNHQLLFNTSESPKYTDNFSRNQSTANRRHGSQCFILNRVVKPTCITVINNTVGCTSTIFVEEVWSVCFLVVMLDCFFLFLFLVLCCIESFLIPF